MATRPVATEGTTHGPGCWAWGKAHYRCALGEIADLDKENASIRHDLERSMANHVADINE